MIAGKKGYFTKLKERVIKMQARAPLMIEHRNIEQMLLVIKAVLARSVSKQEIDPVFVDTAVDFIKVYADRTHHGKEEDILFQRMRNKPLSVKDLRIMNELIDEHRFARQTTAELVAANSRYRDGDNSALTEIAAKLKIFIEFYPIHIAKEDNEFFPSSRAYFTDEEDQAMLAEFWEFDRKMIHEKYRSVIEKLKNQL
jgi:hemerythrin-like domain-containing protein